MAKIQFTLNEIAAIAKKNNFLPDIIEEITCNKEEVGFVIRSPIPIVSKIKGNIKFQKYENGILHISHNKKILRKILNMFVDPTKDLDWIELKNTEIIININSLLERNVRGITISEMYFEENDLIIKT